MRKKFYTIILFSAIGFLFSVECGKPIFCYIATYAVYRIKPATFTPDDVDPFLCTHIIYAHLGIAKDSAFVQFTDPHADMPYGLGLVEKVAALKEKNPSLKVLFSLGGWNEGSKKFSYVASSPSRRKELAKHIAATLQVNGYDGIDMNWMHPNHRGGTPQDVQNYVLLLKEVRKELKKSNYLTVALMSGNEYIYKRAYDIKGMARHLDFILLISYDYHGFWDNRTGVAAPLYSKTDSLSVDGSVTEFISQGVWPEKLIMGFTTSGRTFTANQDIRLPQVFGVAAEKSFTTAWTKELGFIGYNEICHEFEKNENWEKYWDPESMTPFAINGRLLISHDDIKSFQAKLDYLRAKNLGGAMVWSLDTDDFTGDCFGIKYPLVRLIKEDFESVSDIEPFNATSTRAPLRYNQSLRSDRTPLQPTRPSPRYNQSLWNDNTSLQDFDELEDEYEGLEFKPPKIISVEIINVLFE